MADTQADAQLEGRERREQQQQQKERSGKVVKRQSSAGKGAQKPNPRIGRMEICPRPSGVPRITDANDFKIPVKVPSDDSGVTTGRRARQALQAPAEKLKKPSDVGSVGWPAIRSWGRWSLQGIRERPRILGADLDCEETVRRPNAAFPSRCLTELAGTQLGVLGQLKVSVIISRFVR